MDNTGTECWGAFPSWQSDEEKLPVLVNAINNLLTASPIGCCGTAVGWMGS